MHPKMPPPGTKKPEVAIAIGVQPKKPMDGATDDIGGKESAEDAIVLRGGEKICEQCTNYQHDGTCAKVDGQFDPDDRCLRYFDAGGEADEEAVEPTSMTKADMGTGSMMPPPGM